MKKVFLSIILLVSILITSCGPKHDFTACEEHLKSCPISEDCPEHPLCEAHEKCEKDKDCKEHLACEAFEHR
ncbi:MAG: hypothetical protein C0490_23665 [Marivirga sp.]|nr:hypothetical protein [Marivirga sp.]